VVSWLLRLVVSSVVMSIPPVVDSSHLPPQHGAHQRSASLSLSPPTGSPPPQLDAQMLLQRLMMLEQQQQLQATQLQQTTQQPQQLPSQVRKPPIPSPKSFTGDGAYSIDEWIDDVEKHFRHHLGYFTSDAACIEWSSNYLGGKANGWWKSTQKERLANGVAIVTWVNMKRELLTRFQPVDSATVARNALDKMVQKGSVQSYTEFFYRQMNYIKDMSVPDQLHAYTRGLKASIRAEVLKAKPPTVWEAVNVANTAESYTNVGSGHGQYASSSSSSRYPHRSYNGTSSGSAPMEVSNINQLHAANEDALAIEDGPTFWSERGEPEESTSARAAGESQQMRELMAMVKDLQLKQQFHQSVHALFQSNNGGGSSSSSSGSGRSNPKPRVENVSKEDFERCRKENRCLNCKKKNHVARDCTSAFSLKY
jgi:hypothetical protein